MATLKPSENNYKPAFEDLSKNAPEGTYAATIVDIKDEFGVLRKKFESEEMEKVDVTTFLFGYRDKAGQAHKVSSRTVKISGNEKSALFLLLKSILGRAPQYGWDYCELKGKKCLITVEHISRKDGSFYPAISALSPLPEGYGTAPAPVAAPVVEQPKPQPAMPAPVDIYEDSEIPF
ncbi:MAG TPA: hypothetical protein DD381_06975 [Lentisphaeria bacterium]|nr:MAG: hypothetical protein A2X47_10935 [Lentisphaerae bacterium GWF2_38_69]HBM16066.1 hypothetical protein [Lentisphaeria bacterium]